MRYRWYANSPPFYAGEMNERKIKLDEYEEWIESELKKGNFVPVENLKEWKEALEKAAARTLEKR